MKKNKLITETRRQKRKAKHIAKRKGRIDHRTGKPDRGWRGDDVRRQHVALQRRCG